MNATDCVAPTMFPTNAFYTGRQQAREAVIKQIYCKYYRRKFAAGDFRASWIPNAEKLRRIYEKAHEKGSDTSKAVLLTINPAYHENADRSCGWKYLLDVAERLQGYSNFIPGSAYFCLEHRGDHDHLQGTHMHIAFDNENALPKSDCIRRVKACCDIICRDHPWVTVSNQSIDFKHRPLAAAQQYVKKNRPNDVHWGFGFQGDFATDMEVIRGKLSSIFTRYDGRNPARPAEETDEIPPTNIVENTLRCIELLESDDDALFEKEVIPETPSPQDEEEVEEDV